MAENEEKFEMSLFDDSLELNLDYVPEEITEEQEAQEEDQENTEETEIETEETVDNKQKDNLDEDESSEEVVEEEEAEEGEDDSPNNLYSSFATVLNEQGLLPSLDLENTKVENLDDLTVALKSEINEQVKTYLTEKLGVNGYEALEKGISLLEYQQYEDNVDTLDSITEDQLSEDLELSKKLIEQDYLAQGIDKTRVNRLLKKIIDAGEESIIEDAKESLTSLKALEAKRIEKLAEDKQAAIQKQQQLQEKIDNDLKNSIYNKQEFIEGLEVNKAIKDKVYKGITTIIGKSPSGVPENKLMKDRREDPIEFDSKLYYLYEITNGFKDFSKIVQKSKTSASKQLEKQLRNTKFETSGKPTFLSDPDSYGGVGSELVI